MSVYSDLFKDLAKFYGQMDIQYPHLKAVTLAQWALESDRGNSPLATEQLNFGGLKWRDEMSGYATRIWYEAHDGGDYYCKFASLEAFIKGYWIFINRSPYAGWENHAASGEAFIRFIGPIYCPNPGYVEKVLSLLPEAINLIGGG